MTESWFSDKLLRILDVSIARLSKTPFPLLKPLWDLLILQYLSTYHYSRFLTIFSNVLLIQEAKLIGLYDQREAGFRPGFDIGITIWVFQLVGISASLFRILLKKLMIKLSPSMGRLKMVLNGILSTPGHVFFLPLMTAKNSVISNSSECSTEKSALGIWFYEMAGRVNDLSISFAMEKWTGKWLLTTLSPLENFQTTEEEVDADRFSQKTKKPVFFLYLS